MARTHMRVGAGLIVIQDFEPGSNPPAVANTIYTAGKWTVTPAVNVEFIKTLRGADGIAVVTGYGEATVALEFMEVPLRVEAMRTMGKVDFVAANTSAHVAYVSSFQYGGGLKSASDLKTAVDALTPATNADPGLYQMVIAGSTTPVMQRISPKPSTIAMQTDVLSAAPASTVFTPASPPANSGGTVIFAVNSATDGAFTSDLSDPQAPLSKISLFSDFDLGNSFQWVEIDAAVPNESVFESERGAANNIAQTYRVLGGEMRIGQFNYSKLLDGLEGLA